MDRLTPKFANGASNEGQVVTLADGEKFRFLWSGLIARTSQKTITRSRNGNLATPFLCRRCGKKLRKGEPYYNRKRLGATKKSRFYCLDCSLVLGFIERYDTE